MFLRIEDGQTVNLNNIDRISEGRNGLAFMKDGECIAKLDLVHKPWAKKEEDGSFYEARDVALEFCVKRMCDKYVTESEFVMGIEAGKYTLLDWVKFKLEIGEQYQ